MQRTWKLIALPVAAIALALFSGCESMPWNKDETKKMDASAGGGGASAVAKLTASKAAATQPSWGKASGTVTFTPAGEGKVKVAYDLSGLTPGKHGFHIHEKGDLSAPDLSSAGPHFNPSKHKHAGPEAGERHAGDLGNVEADASGNAKSSLTVSGISIGTGAADDIIGKSVILHEKADDLKSDPAGNAGGRIAGGVIELKK
jgi:Cu-Zn family superoxide dismutase